MNPPEVLFLSFETLGVAYSIHINGIKVAADRFEVQSTNAFPINQWLQPGKNELKLNLSVPYEQEEYRENKKATIRIIEPGEEAGTEKVIAEIAWSDQDGQSFPVNLSIDFEVQIDFPKPAWIDADILLEEDKDPAMHFIRSFHKVLDQGDMIQFQEIAKVKTHEMATAYGMDPNQRLEGQRKFMGDLFSDPAWGMEPLNTATLFFEIQCNGKILTVTNQAGQSSMYSKALAEGTIFHLDLHLARKMGDWFLCR